MQIYLIHADILYTCRESTTVFRNIAQNLGVGNALRREKTSQRVGRVMGEGLWELINTQSGKFTCLPRRYCIRFQVFEKEGYNMVEPNARLIGQLKRVILSPNISVRQNSLVLIVLTE